MQAGKNADKTSATVEGKGEKMTALDPIMKEGRANQAEKNVAARQVAAAAAARGTTMSDDGKDGSHFPDEGNNWTAQGLNPRSADAVYPDDLKTNLNGGSGGGAPTSGNRSGGAYD